jgi:hypothetical protein
MVHSDRSNHVYLEILSGVHVAQTDRGITLNFDGSPITYFKNTYSPITLSNISSIKLVSIFRNSSSPNNAVYVSGVDFSDIVFSLSSHRHSYLRCENRPDNRLASREIGLEMPCCPASDLLWVQITQSYPNRLRFWCPAKGLVGKEVFTLEKILP